MFEQPSRTAFEIAFLEAGLDTDFIKLQTAVSICVCDKKGKKAIDALWMLLSKNKALAAAAMSVIITTFTKRTIHQPATRPNRTVPDVAKIAERRAVITSGAVALVKKRAALIEQTIKDRLCWLDGQLVAKSTKYDLLARKRSGAYEAELARLLYEKMKNVSDKSLTVGTVVSTKDLEGFEAAAKEAGQKAIVA